jgi:hypothetical protein
MVDIVIQSYAAPNDAVTRIVCWVPIDPGTADTCPLESKSILVATAGGIVSE